MAREIDVEEIEIDVVDRYSDMCRAILNSIYIPLPDGRARKRLLQIRMEKVRHLDVE